MIISMPFKMILLLLFIGLKDSYAQTYETMSKVYIPPTAVIVQTIKVKNCDEVFPKGHIVKKEYTKTNGDINYTITKIDTLDTDRSFPIEKSIKKEMTGFDGYANITVDEKDKSLLHLNYWLNDYNPVDKKIKIKISNRKLNCVGQYDSKDTTYIVQSDTTFNLWKSFTSDMSTDWFKNSSQIIEVYKENDPNILDYYLVNRYDKDADYTMKLENREFVSYRKQSLEFGPLTIPFKFRFGYSRNDIYINEEFTTDLNVGIFGGYKIGKYRVRYEGSSLKDLANISCTIGGFLNLSSAGLDSLSTTSSKTPFKKEEKATIGILSPGFGAMLTVYNFQIGVFLGWDFGFGRNAKNWNFNNRPWLGFGIGYSLTSFWKK